MITRQEGFYRLAREYVAMQGAPRAPGAFSELYVRGYEAAVETALDRQEEGRTISWVRLAYDRAVDDVHWTADDLFPAGFRKNETIVTLLQFEWGLYGEGEWVAQDYDDTAEIPEWLSMGRMGDIIGHTTEDPVGLRETSFWRFWPSGWEKWTV